MGKFFEQLASKLAERWVTLLLVPGALFVSLAVVGARLGHRHALDWSRAQQSWSETATAISHRSAGAQTALLIVALLAAAGTGLVVQALAGATRQVWLGRWPRLSNPLQRRLIRRRSGRWHKLLEHRRALERDNPPDSRSGEQQEKIDTLAARMLRIAPAEPGRPTWMGDRMHALEQVALHRYGLDLTFGWPRLWLVLPDSVRAELTAAEAAFASAVATGTWAWPYLVLGTVWWPAALIGAGVGVTGWVRGRAATADLAALSEAAIDLHGRTLVVALGIGEHDANGPLTVAEGQRVTAIVRKGR